MCLLIHSETKPTPQRAKKRIQCWKVVKINPDGSISTPFENYPIKRSRIVAKGEEIITRSIARAIWLISEGFIHSYADEVSALRCRDELMLGTICEYKVVKAYIPLGTKYFEEDADTYTSKTYASKRIVLKQKIKDIIAKD